MLTQLRLVDAIIFGQAGTELIQGITLFRPR